LSIQVFDQQLFLPKAGEEGNYQKRRWNDGLLSQVLQLRDRLLLCIGYSAFTI
jgi:hypothetical protein